MSPAYIPGKSCCLGNHHFFYNLVTWNKGARKVEIKPVATAEGKKRLRGKKNRPQLCEDREETFFFSFYTDDNVTLQGISGATLLPATKLGSV